MNTNIDEKLGFILGRRSIRAYSSAPVSEAAVQKMLEAAMAAPSAVARDPWRFVVIRNRQTLGRIAAELPNGGMLATAGVGIVVCGDLEAAHDRQLSYLLQDCSAAIENLLLAAHILGLGACWLGVHPREQRVKSLQQILSLPASVIPVACISIGHPAEQKEPRTRFNRSVVHFEKCGGKRSAQRSARLPTCCPRGLQRWISHPLPVTPVAALCRRLISGNTGRADTPARNRYRVTAGRR